MRGLSRPSLTDKVAAAALGRADISRNLMPELAKLAQKVGGPQASAPAMDAVLESRGNNMIGPTHEPS